jgi:hypothetical protein
MFDIPLCFLSVYLNKINFFFKYQVIERRYNVKELSNPEITLNILG